jgi:hypothetical protein
VAFPSTHRADIDPGGNGTLNIPERIIEQYFVVTDVNVDGRYAGKSSVEGRSQGMIRVGAASWDVQVPRSVGE